MDRDEELPPGLEPATFLARDQLRGEQQSPGDRQAALHAERRRLPDADQEGSAGAGSAVFQAGAEMSRAGAWRFAPDAMPAAALDLTIDLNRPPTSAAGRRSVPSPASRRTNPPPAWPGRH